MGARFRFQNLKIWQLAVEITDEFLYIAKMDFSKFLNYTRISTFKNPNILIILNRRNLLQEERLEQLLDKFDKESRIITNFKKHYINRFALCPMRSATRRSQ